MNTFNNTILKPWDAIRWGLICPGLGQIYCGRVKRGLLIYCGSMWIGVLIVGSMMFASSTAMQVAFLGAIVAGIWLQIWSVRDAGRIARTMADVEYQRQDYNDPNVYRAMGSVNVLLALVAALLLRANVVEAFIIPSRSMAPTLMPGDRILVSKLGLSTTTFQRGDVVVFRNPIDRKLNFVKRIIGLPGETIEIRHGQIFVDGQPLDQSPVESKPDAEQEPKGTGENTSAPHGRTLIERAGQHAYVIRINHPETPINLPPVTVAPDAYYVLGDNRDLSSDSREFGNVPHGLVAGLVRGIYYPAQSWKRWGGLEEKR